jgi:dolichol-phosphate mannosyltransferase
VKAPAGAGDFRLVDRKALDAFLSLRETHRFVRGMWDWIGFRQVGVPYVPEQRHAGKSKYTISKMTRFALDGIFGFSSVPLRIALGLGGLLALASLVGGTGEIVARLADPRLVPAWAPIALILSAVLAIQLLSFGLLGEYVARIYDEVKGRPIYIVRDRHGFEELGVNVRHARRPLVG